jgi:hypothetical protein
MRNFILGIAVGAIGLHILHRMGYMGATPPKTQEEKDAAVSDVMEEAKSYGDALKRQFDIVMPSDVVSKRAEELGKVFTQGRYSIDPTREKAPLSI